MSRFDFDQVFGDDYLHFYSGELTDERSQKEADLIVRLLDLKPEMRVLDIPCGHGRIAQRLAAFGCSVVGIDSSERFLAVARRAAPSVDFRPADMRHFTADAEFDAIVNWFTSIGYYDDATDRAILAGWRKALKPGGKLIVEHQNRERIIALIAHIGDHSDHFVDRGNDLLVDRTTYDPASGRMNTERISVRDGQVHRYHFSVRSFSFNELRQWLLDAGFAEVDGYGPDGEPYGLQSRRMVAVART